MLSDSGFIKRIKIVFSGWWDVLLENKHLTVIVYFYVFTSFPSPSFSHQNLSSFLFLDLYSTELIKLLLFNTLIEKNTQKWENCHWITNCGAFSFFFFFYRRKNRWRALSQIDAPNSVSLAWHAAILCPQETDPGFALKNVFPDGNEMTAATERSFILEDTTYQKEQLCSIAAAILRTCANMQLWCKWQTQRRRWRQCRLPDQTVDRPLSCSKRLIRGD